MIFNGILKIFMHLNPKLYEINTRVWLSKMNLRLSEVPFSFFEELKAKGIDIIWLMGVWKNSEETTENYCFTPELIASYDKALKDWTKEDVIGSPYAIESYTVNPRIGNFDDILSLKKKLNSIGLKLMLDFIPNHFSAASPLLQSNPELFLQADDELMERDPFTFYRDEASGKIFAHGRDPLFSAWQDTVQVNFFNPEARKFLSEQIIKLIKYCDGLRCDMAMLPLNNVFSNTWVGPINKQGLTKPKEEFWTNIIITAKEKNPDFIFLAETYWDLEWDLQQLGFDFTYDKRLLDRLELKDIEGVKAHLKADMDFQNKSTRFIENHDEQRAAVKFGKFRSLAAAAVISTIPGMKLYYHGQFEGARIKLPLQLKREPLEKTSATAHRFYESLLQITNNDIFRYGTWVSLEPSSAGTGNETFRNFFAWMWVYGNSRRLILINYSEVTSQCRLKLNIDSESEIIVLCDLLNERTFERYKKEIKNPGLFVELKAYGAHFFSW